jgi:CRISPR-associated protein Cmr3
MTTYVTMRPVDVLHLRGNRLFAEAGHGAAVMPPWPSVFAGALRTRMLVDLGVDPADFARGVCGAPRAREIVGGGPDALGSFRVCGVSLVGPPPAVLRQENGPHTASPTTTYHPLPADLVVLPESDPSKLRVERLEPVPVSALGAMGSYQLAAAPVLRSASREKPVGGCWVTGEGLRLYLDGQSVLPSQVVRSSTLWGGDSRLGIALSTEARTAREGLLYTTDAVALRPGVAFLVGVAGADGAVPTTGLARLGGDGRGAEIAPWTHQVAAPVSLGRRFRMILSTPGFFRGGWLPPGVTRQGDDLVLEWAGLRARLMAAAVPRSEVVSGWDVARRQPKPAVRVVPAGAVYWFERLEGDPKILGKLESEGLWPLFGEPAPGEQARRAEGFNNVWFGAWPDDAAGQKES